MSDTLRAQQWALTAHLRDPQHQPAPAGLDETRLQVYRDLLFNTLQALLAGSFPVLLQVLDDDEMGGAVPTLSRHAPLHLTAVHRGGGRVRRLAAGGG